MNLVIDIGNTSAKVAVFDDNRLIMQDTFSALDEADIQTIKHNYPGINHVMVSSVRKAKKAVKELLEAQFNQVHVLDESIPLPVTNTYQTKSTLGFDRLAAACGAHYISPDTHLLIIDAGTAITYDYIDANNTYIGGNIAPGIHMRFRALSDYTNQLPLREQQEDFPEIGKNTSQAITAGVQMGVIHETKSYIDRFKENHPGGKVYLTGGDAYFLEKRIKNNIFVIPNLLLIGLNYILNYYVNT